MKHLIPADVPSSQRGTFEVNYQLITKKTDKLFLFACDQKIEHLNSDFHGNTIHPDALNPEHLFKIAANSPIGAMAAPLGLIAHYCKQYKNIAYIVKLNGKTDLDTQSDPYSGPLWTINDVVQFRNESALPIAGAGITLYPGSEFEARMLEYAAQAIFQAHQQGLVTIVWIYPRGASIKHDQDPELLAGATGLANALGADFVKIKPPVITYGKKMNEWLEIIIAAAGNTKVIFSGGSQKNEVQLLQEIGDYLKAGASGCAIGRNIFQRSFQEATQLATKISSLIFTE